VGVDLRCSVGEVSDVYSERRDRFSLPNPSIGIAARVDGGMSGGAAFDESGRLIGIISRGDDTSSFVSLLWPSVFTPIDFARKLRPGRQASRAQPRGSVGSRPSTDSPLEGDGFELSVPRQRRHPSATANRFSRHHFREISACASHQRLRPLRGNPPSFRALQA
jgi:hypothetical protein